jgi:hypothetical protein
MHRINITIFALTLLGAVAVIISEVVDAEEKQKALQAYCYDMGYSKAINVSRDLAYCYKLENGTEVIIKVIK